MANDKSFKIKNGLSAKRYLQNSGIDTAGSNGPFGVFSTDIWTGNNSVETITNGIDLANDGGLTWFKARANAQSHILIDSVRGLNKTVYSNETRAEATQSWSITYNSNGMTLPATATDPSNGLVNNNGYSMVAWTFKKEPSFFDIVTYTGTGVAGRTLSHSLGSVPGMVLIKPLTTGEWSVYHRGLDSTSPENYYLSLDTTAARVDDVTRWNDTAPTSTEITLGNNNRVNENGEPFVAYLFAHDTASDSDIKCGSYTGNGSATNREIDIGFKPSWLMIKSASSAYNWIIIDSTRGEGEDPPTANVLAANLSNAEDPAGDRLFFSDSGFTLSTGSFDYNKNGDDFIYMAIRAVVPTQTLDLSTGHTFSFTPSAATDILFSNPPA